MEKTLRIGCAGWSIPRDLAGLFPPGGSHLQRMAAVFDATEINSSFYKPHRTTTYARWAGAVPDDFRFSVKFPKAVTHAGALGNLGEARAFLSGAFELGPKLGAILVQLPPSGAFDDRAAGRFFETIRKVFVGVVACEPRHASWFGDRAGVLLREYHVARVAADPAPLPDGRVPGGWSGARYYRLHGSPRRYTSSYDDAFLRWLTDVLRPADVPTWVIFDNTARGAAPENALRLRALVDGPPALLVQ